MKKIKWGIWGTGYIANRVAQSFKHTQKSQLYCVLSRTPEKAQEFAKKHEAIHAYGNVEEMLADDALDVVYIATPNVNHLENTLSCIKAGKHVLCDKPMATNISDTKKMIDAAADAGLFLMEGMWTRFFPVIRKVCQWIESGRIGRPLRFNCNFSFVASPSGWRCLDGKDAGALLDVGIYCITLASLAFGLTPSDILSTAYIDKGTDIANSVVLKFEDDQIAAFTSALDCESDLKAIIAGEKGYIEVRNPFYAPNLALLYEYNTQNNKSEASAKCSEHVDQSYPSTGFQFELDHVSDCIAAGWTESDIMPHKTTLEAMQLMEDIRAKW